MEERSTTPHCHFGAIGIEDVFLDAPDHAFPSGYSESAVFTSSEMVGTIQSKATDFVVREIAPADRQIPGFTDAEIVKFQVADWKPANILHDCQAKAAAEEMGLTELPSLPDRVPLMKALQSQPVLDTSVAVAATAKVAAAAAESPVQTVNLSQRLEELLSEIATRYSQVNVVSIMTALQALEKKALARIAELEKEQAKLAEKVIEEKTEFPKTLSPITESSSKTESAEDTKKDDSDSDSHNQDGASSDEEEPEEEPMVDQAIIDEALEDPAGKVVIPPVECRGFLQNIDTAELHEALKLAFPLLEPKKGKDAILLSIDTVFFDLVPFLRNPIEDLPLLYIFHKRGYVPIEKTTTKPQPHLPPKPTKSDKRKRTRDEGDESDDRYVFLRIHHYLTKDDRMTLHALISKKNRLLTSHTTKIGIIRDSIRIHFDPKAVQHISNKARRMNKRSFGNSTFFVPNNNTLLVVKKSEQPHLTMLHALSRHFGVRTNDIGLAGIKDRKAITFQFATVRDLTIKSGVVQEGIDISIIGHCSFFLSPGDCQGNRFDIRVRNLQQVHVKNGQEILQHLENGHLVEHAFQRVIQHGFVNFYSQIRVGAPTDEIKNFDIGRAMLQGDFRQAINLFMLGRSEKVVRAAWKQSGGDPTATLKALGGTATPQNERDVLEELERYNDPVSAFKCLPHSVRRFWITAYQAYLWNRMTSARLQLARKTVIVGDMFLPDSNLRDDDVSNRRSVQVVTADNVRQITLEQVVLPLPGYGVVYPHNEIGELYQKVLKDDGIELKKKKGLDAGTTRGPDAGTAKGAYRRLIAKATNMSMSLEDGGTTMRLTFDLPAVSFAKMLLREMMYTTVVRDPSLDSFESS